MQSPIQIALLYLASHFREDILLDEIAHQTGLSKFHFHRLFVKENQCTPRFYLEKLRMEHAAHYMFLYADVSLIEVAFESGYSSPACFSRAFKKFFDLSPSKYRAQKKLTKPKIKTRPFKELVVQYFPNQTLEVQKVKLNFEKLNDVYQSIAAGADDTLETVGFFLDVPFHVPLDECRYYVGVSKAPIKNKSHALTMPAGFYTAITINGEFDALKEKLFELRDRLDSCGYSIDALIGYEKIVLRKEMTPFNYKLVNRELYIKIKRI